MQPMTYKELSCDFIADLGIPDQFRTIITFINDRKGIQYDFKNVEGKFFCSFIVFLQRHGT